MTKPNPLGGRNRDLQAQRSAGGPQARSALLHGRLPLSAGEGQRLAGPVLESVSATMVLEGSDLGAVTTVPLSFGKLDLGTGQPGIPVCRPFALRWVAASFLATIGGGDPWTLRLWVHRAGGVGFSEVRTLEVDTA